MFRREFLTSLPFVGGLLKTEKIDHISVLFEKFAKALKNKGYRFKVINVRLWCNKTYSLSVQCQVTKDKVLVVDYKLPPDMTIDEISTLAHKIDEEL